MFFLLVHKPWFGESTGRHHTEAVIRCAEDAAAPLDGGGKAKTLKLPLA